MTEVFSYGNWYENICKPLSRIKWMAIMVPEATARTYTIVYIHGVTITTLIVHCIAGNIFPKIHVFPFIISTNI